MDMIFERRMKKEQELSNPQARNIYAYINTIGCLLWVPLIPTSCSQTLMMLESRNFAST